MHTVGYVTRSSPKVQEKGESQVFLEPKVTNKSNPDLESLLITHPWNTSQHSATNLDAKLNIMLSWQRTLKNTPEHAKTLEHSEKLAKLIKFYLMSEDDREAQINSETIKKISAEDSVFSTPSLELCTVFKVLQEFD